MAKIITEPERKDLEDKAGDHVAEVHKLASLGEPGLEDQKMDLRLIKDIAIVGRDAARFMRHCPSQTQGLGFTADAIEADITQGETKVSVGNILIAGGLKLREEGQAQLRRASSNSGKALDLVTTTQDSPLETADKAHILQHAQPLIDFRNARKQSYRDARQKGKQVKGKVAGLEKDNKVLSVEKKYYAGDDLKPADIMIDSKPRSTQPSLPPRGRRRKEPR